MTINIVSISGRKGSGKSEIAKLLVEKGFEKISFADYLKELVCSLYNWNLFRMGELLYKEEILTIPVFWNKTKANELEAILNIKKNALFVNDKTFLTRRQAIQYIGTEVLRRLDINFHVDNLIKRIQPDKKYVLDDVRFPNELEAMKRIGALCLFIFRPGNFEYSNHSSEISLLRSDFEHVLINDKSKTALIKCANNFFKTMLSTKPLKINKQQIQSILNTKDSTKEIANKLECSSDKLVWWAKKYLVKIDNKTYTLNDNAFFAPSEQASYWAGYFSADGCIKTSSGSKTTYLIELSSIDLVTIERFKKFLNSDKPIYFRKGSGYSNKTKIYYFVACSPYIIEDLKLWCLRPKKGVNNELPTIILNNEIYMKAWYIGLIDGDGTIFRKGKTGALSISLLGSMEVLAYLKNWCSIKSGTIRQEKNIAGLYKLTYSGKYAEQFAQWVNPGKIGLERKWARVAKPK